MYIGIKNKQFLIKWQEYLQIHDYLIDLLYPHYYLTIWVEVQF